MDNSPLIYTDLMTSELAVELGKLLQLSPRFTPEWRQMYADKNLLAARWAWDCFFTIPSELRGSFDRINSESLHESLQILTGLAVSG